MMLTMAFASLVFAPVPILLGPVADTIPGSKRQYSTAPHAHLNSEGPMHAHSCKVVAGGARFLVYLQSVIRTRAHKDKHKHIHSPE